MFYRLLWVNHIACLQTLFSCSTELTRESNICSLKPNIPLCCIIILFLGRSTDQVQCKKTWQFSDCTDPASWLYFPVFGMSCLIGECVKMECSAKGTDVPLSNELCWMGWGSKITSLGKLRKSRSWQYNCYCLTEHLCRNKPQKQCHYIGLIGPHWMLGYLVFPIQEERKGLGPTAVWKAQQMAELHVMSFMSFGWLLIEKFHF